jgi:hypothetical protein
MRLKRAITGDLKNIRAGNICSTSVTCITNAVTNHVRRRDNGVTPGSPEE